ncbi:leucine-rich repeat domain-containing protein [Bifidobacterium sp. ESL0732]|uniref:leucine-rich repeat domain-containing protein n=1 Tax=Bifidobacterium sp. ESL0732 TaxID=2983222 RepID=UPI0023F81147|nr:leucine-rich repeat domain-containing protein [Bifidobacterium sp. ESL0732]WEV63686.1 InlB B-repeat-containing protein [Bifidobacterium sp. ESL0732]
MMEEVVRLLVRGVAALISALSLMLANSPASALTLSSRQVHGNERLSSASIVSPRKPNNPVSFAVDKRIRQGRVNFASQQTQSALPDGYHHGETAGQKVDPADSQGMAVGTYAWHGTIWGNSFKVFFRDPVVAKTVAEMLGKQVSDSFTYEMSLSITSLDLSHRNVQYLDGTECLTMMTSLNASYNNIAELPDLSVNSMQNWHSLQSLSLGGNQLTNVDGLKYVTTLKYLALYGNKLGDNAHLGALGSSAGLWQVDLTGNQLNDVSKLNTLTNLRELYLGNNRIADMSVIASLPNLTFQGTTSFPDPMSPQTIVAPSVRTKVGQPLSVNVAGKLKGGNNSLLALSGPQPSTGVTMNGGTASWAAVPPGQPHQVSVQFSEPAIGSSGKTTPFHGTVVQPYELDSYTVSFVGQDGTTMSPVQTVFDSDKALRPTVEPAPSNAGLSFMGWGTVADASPNGKGLMQTYDFTTAVTSNLTLYPLWGVKWSESSTAKSCTMGIDTITACFPDTHLAAKVAATLGLSHRVSDVFTQANAESITDLEANASNIAGIQGLQLLTKLTNLNLNDNGLISDISPIATIVELQEVMLGSNAITTLEPLRTASLPNLVSLAVAHNQISDFSPLVHISSLTSLDAGANKITDLSAISEMTGLKRLSINLNNLADISKLATLTALVHFDASENDIKDIGVVTYFTHIQELYLEKNHIFDISPLNGLTTLTNADISNQTITYPSVVANPNVSVESAIGVDGNHVVPSASTPAGGNFDADTGKVTWTKRAENGTAIVDFNKTLSIGTASVPFSGRITQPYTVIKYMVSVDKHDGSAQTSQQIALGQPIPDPGTPQRDGYHFIGWTTDSSGEGDKVDFATATVTGDVTLHAMWERALTGLPSTGHNPWMTWFALAGGIVLSVLIVEETRRKQASWL